MKPKRLVLVLAIAALFCIVGCKKECDRAEAVMSKALQVIVDVQELVASATAEKDRLELVMNQICEALGVDCEAATRAFGRANDILAKANQLTAEAEKRFSRAKELVELICYGFGLPPEAGAAATVLGETKDRLRELDAELDAAAEAAEELRKELDGGG